jgi:hypothetical protein
VVAAPVATLATDTTVDEPITSVTPVSEIPPHLQQQQPCSAGASPLELSSRPTPLPPLAAPPKDAAALRLQLSMRCDYAAPGELGREGSEAQRETYAGATAAFRDMVMAGDCSAWELVRAVLVAFGLADGTEPIGSVDSPVATAKKAASSGRSGVSAGSGEKKVKALLQDDIVMLQDVVSTDTAFKATRIAGLKYVDQHTALVGLKELRVRSPVH